MLAVWVVRVNMHPNCNLKFEAALQFKLTIIPDAELAQKHHPNALAFSGEDLACLALTEPRVWMAPEEWALQPVPAPPPMMPLVLVLALLVEEALPPVVLDAQVAATLATSA